MTNKFSPVLLEAINCLRNASVMDTYDPGDELDATWRHAHSEECKLFDIFKRFTDEDLITYKAFAQWLNENGMAQCDLTTIELLNIFLMLHFP